MPQEVNPGSRYRCGKRTVKSSLWATAGGKGGLESAVPNTWQADTKHRYSGFEVVVINNKGVYCADNGE